MEEPFYTLPKQRQDYLTVLFSLALCNQLSLIYANYFRKEKETTPAFKALLLRQEKSNNALKKYIGQTMLDEEEQKELAAQFGEQLEAGVRAMLIEDSKVK